MGLRRASGLGLLWGFAEATLFFVVPDVVVSWVALRSWRRAALVAVWAALGAAAGGAGMATWAARSPQVALSTVERVPAISAAMVERVGDEMREDGFVPMLRGAFRGQPYKLYAAQTGAEGLSIAALVLWTLPARLPRFLLVALAIHLWSRYPLRAWSERRKKILLGGSWILFYLLFFLLMPN